MPIPTPLSYTVTSTADDGSAGTLRAAITFANSNPGTTISFDAALTGTTITLTSELPLILGDQTIIDGGTTNVTVSGNDRFRVFFVGDTTHATSVAIENITISHAFAKGGGPTAGVGDLSAAGGGGGAGLGGAI